MNGTVSHGETGSSSTYAPVKPGPKGKRKGLTVKPILYGLLAVMDESSLETWNDLLHSLPS